MNLGEKCCRWPDGSERIVQLTSILPNSKGYILWNEKHAPILGESDCIVGLDDEVPLDWLREVSPKTLIEICKNYHKRG